mmetsp:Transcript_50112/g.93765  ORF Transcript_50112/g.93765 Transcript_50112/m.93765 type:complete len:613 (-) Transcript_50112:102-1940(-)
MMGMFGDESPEQQAKNIRKEYDRKHKYVVQEAFENLEKQHSWVHEFFPEPMPLENKYGTSFTHLLNTLSPEGKVEGYQDDPDTVLPTPDNVLVFADQAGYAKNILKYAPKTRLGRQKIVTTSPGKITQEMVKDLLDEQWDLVIFGYSIDIPTSNDVEDIHKAQDDMFCCLMYLIQHISANQSAQRMVVLTCDLLADDPEIHEQIGPSLVAYAGLTGFINTARQEMMCKIMHVDTEWSLPEMCMPMLSSEVFRRETFAQNVVRILKQGRYVCRMVPSAPYENQKEYTMPTKGVFIITGGNGSTAQVIINWILDRASAQVEKLSGLKILCTSRSAKVTEQNLAMATQVKKKADKLGAEVLQIKCDCSNRADITKLIEENTPNIVGVVHTAGALYDTLLSKMTWELMEQSFNPKSRAALYIHDALEKFENPGMGLCVFFSSISVGGSPGQLNYSTSNSYQDGLARHRVAMGKPATSCQWTNWAEVGMFTTLAKKFQDRILSGPYLTITNVEGIDILERLISTGIPYGWASPHNNEIIYAMFTQEPLEHGYGRLMFSQFIPFPLLKKEMPESAYVSYRAHMDNRAKFRAYNFDEGILYKQFVKGIPLGYEDEEDED